jgi:cytochrome P450
MAQLLAKGEIAEPGLLATVQRWTKDEVVEEEEALFLLTLLWFAGIDNSTIALGRVMEFLLKNPHQWQELKGNTKNQLKFIEEVLRLKPPTTFIQRSVVKDVQLGGQMLQAGERIWLNILAANRDPEKFSQPDMLDLNGNNSKHLVFGYGMHQCIGMSLVRWEAKALLQVVLPIIETFQNLGDAEMTVYGAPVVVNPITFLQVRFSSHGGSCP